MLGILAGLVNRNVVDGNRFAAHVDAVRRDPAVARQDGPGHHRSGVAGRPSTDRRAPTRRVGQYRAGRSVAFGPAVRSAARTFHATITDEEPGEIDLRLLDVGAAIVGLLPVVAPTAAPAVPADLSVTLTSVKEHGFVAWLLHLSRFAGQLAWLLPLLALLLLVAAVVIAPDRGRGVSKRELGRDGERRHGGPARHCDRLVRLHRRRANPARGPRGCNLAPTGGPALVGGRIDRARGRRDARRRIRPDLHGRSRRHRRPRLEVHREDPEYKSDPALCGEPFLLS